MRGWLGRCKSEMSSIVIGGRPSSEVFAEKRKAEFEAQKVEFARQEAAKCKSENISLPPAQRAALKLAIQHNGLIRVVRYSKPAASPEKVKRSVHWQGLNGGSEKFGEKTIVALEKLKLLTRRWLKIDEGSVPDMDVIRVKCPDVFDEVTTLPSCELTLGDFPHPLVLSGVVPRSGATKKQLKRWQEEWAPVVAIALARSTYKLSGTEVKFVRRTVGFQGQQLALMLGVHVTLLSHYEHDRRTIPPQIEQKFRLLALDRLQAGSTGIGSPAHRPLNFDPRIVIRHGCGQWYAMVVDRIEIERFQVSRQVEKRAA
jgi:DNA-binding transcriptional regulator YiaG